MKATVFKTLLALMVLINANMNLYTQVSITACAGQKGIKYQVLGGAGSIYHWMVEGGQIISDPQANTITVNWGNNPGSYTIEVYEERPTGCLGNTKKINVGLKPSPIFDLGNIESICDGEQIELVAGTGANATQNKYLWQDGSINPMFVAKTSGIYWVEVTNKIKCSFRDSIVLVVNPLPSIYLGKDTALCAPAELVLDAGNFFNFYNWSNGANSQTILARENDGKIWVKVIDSNGCFGFDTIQISKCLEHTSIEIPKAFFPDNGVSNGLWIIGGAAKYPFISVKIYDRWGIMVFESEKGYPNPWDGNANGKQLPMDAYYYIINLGDGSKEIVGSVTLIR